MKRLFEIDWPDNYGPNYIDHKSLLDFVTTTSKVVDEDSHIQVRDVTSKEEIVQPLGGHDF